MKYLAAYLLAVIGGNENPTIKDIEHILGAGGLDVDMEDAGKVVNSLSGKSIEELIVQGKEKFKSMPCAGTAATIAAPTTPAVSAQETKKEEPKQEESEEDEDMGFGLFD